MVPFWPQLVTIKRFAYGILIRGDWWVFWPVMRVGVGLLPLPLIAAPSSVAAGTVRSKSGNGEGKRVWVDCEKRRAIAAARLHLCCIASSGMGQGNGGLCAIAAGPPFGTTILTTPMAVLGKLAKPRHQPKPASGTMIR